MADKTPHPAAQWLILTCPSCQAKSRVPAAAAPRGARCPRCGTSILAPQAPAETHVKAGPAPAAEADDEPAEPASPRVKWEEPDPEPEPATPSSYWLLWRGVYSFPWHLHNLLGWFLNGVGFTLVVFCFAVVYWVGEASAPWQAALAFLKGAIAFLLWTGAYAGGTFLAAIQQTAVGHERVKPSDDSLKEKVMSFLYVAWLVVYSAVPVGIVLFPLKWYIGNQIFLLGVLPAVVFVFPWVLLGGLTNGSALSVWNSDLLLRVLRHPLVVLTLYVVSAALLVPCVVLGYLAIAQLQFYLAPPTGFVWATCFLIYGRLLGRVGYLLSEPDLSAKRRRKLKKLPVAGRR
jgi:hypothetical protein